MSSTSHTCDIERSSKYEPIVLTDEQRSHLEKLVRSGSSRARTQTRARILLALDRQPVHAQLEGRIAASLLVHRDTIRNVRRRFQLGGLDRALNDLPRPGAAPKITGDVEAQITLLACSTPPQGHAHWTLRLIADKLVELQLVDSISHVAVGNALKKTRSSRGG